MEKLAPLINVFRYHKLKIAAFIAMTIGFALLLFPYGDLGDLVSVKVSEATQNQVYVRFGDMGFSFAPPGIAFEDVYAESVFFPALKAQSASVSPNLSGLIRFKPGGSIYLEQFLNGNLSASVQGGADSSKGTMKYITELNLEKVDLSEITKLANAPVQINGRIDGETNVDVDPDFVDQPEGEFDIRIDKFYLPYSTVNVNMQGAILPVNLPELTISNIALKGRILKGEIYIDNLRIGNAKDELNGTVRGRLNMRLTKRGVQIFPHFGRYNFSIDIKALPKFLAKLGPMAGLLDGFLGKYKFTEVGGTRYALKMSGNRFGPIPRMEPLK